MASVWSGASSGNDVILGRPLGATGIAGDNVVDAFHDFEYGFGAPEAAAGQDGSLFARSGLDVKGRIGKCSPVGGHHVASHSEESENNGC